MKDEKFKNLKLFLAVLGILFSMPAMAVEYGTTLEVTTQGQVIQLEELVLNPLHAPTVPSRIKVKNGVEFYIQLPTNHQATLDASSTGIASIEGDQIHVFKAGSLGFQLTKDNTRYDVLAHVNYFGVLQYAGGDAPGVIEVTGGNSSSEVYFPDGKFPAIRWFSSDGTHIPSLDKKNRVALATLLETGFSSFKVRTRDGTSNQLPNGLGGGESWNELQLTVPPQTYTVTLSAQPAEGGAVSGDGIFNENSSVTVVAVANHGWHFLHWQHNGTTVSSDSSYSFAVTDNTDLVAVFGMGSSLDELPPATTRAVIADGRLSIYSNSAATVALYDMHGRVLLRSWIEAGATTIPLDIPRGTYFVKVNEKTYKLLY